jgi:hypothetical protein
MPSTTCGWCRRYSNMTAHGQDANIKVHESMGAYNNVTVFGIYRCDYCHKLSLAYHISGSSTAETPASFLHRMDQHINWFPQGSEFKDFPHVPRQIGATAGEAYQCFSVKAYRGAVGLARATIQGVAKEKGIAGGNLYDAIERLHDDGHIRERIKLVAHAIRESANEVLHADLTDVPVSGDEAQLVLKLMDVVLEDVYQVDGGIAELEALRTSRKQGTIDPTVSPILPGTVVEGSTSASSTVEVS